jgi:hypothetical protein
MKVGVIGAGCIGLHFGGHLINAFQISHFQNSTVCFIGRKRIKDKIHESGELIITDRNSPKKITIPSQYLEFYEEISSEALSDCDIIVLTTKSNDTENVGQLLAKIPFTKEGKFRKKSSQTHCSNYCEPSEWNQECRDTKEMSFCINQSDSASGSGGLQCCLASRQSLASQHKELTVIF